MDKTESQVLELAKHLDREKYKKYE